MHGQRLASGSVGNEAVKLWDVATRHEVATLAGEGSIFSLVKFSPDATCSSASTPRARPTSGARLRCNNSQRSRPDILSERPRRNRAEGLLPAMLALRFGASCGSPSLAPAAAQVWHSVGWLFAVEFWPWQVEHRGGLHVGGLTENLHQLRHIDEAGEARVQTVARTVR